MHGRVRVPGHRGWRVGNLSSTRDSCAVRNVLEYIQYAQNFLPRFGYGKLRIFTPRTPFSQIPPQASRPDRHPLTRAKYWPKVVAMGSIASSKTRNTVMFPWRHGRLRTRGREESPGEPVCAPATRRTEGGVPVSVEQTGDDGRRASPGSVDGTLQTARVRPRYHHAQLYLAPGPTTLVACGNRS